MTKQAIIEKTLNAIHLLPNDKAEEISDFADFISKKFEEHQLNKGIQKIAAESKTFEYLSHEEDLYTVADLKVIYNA